MPNSPAEWLLRAAAVTVMSALCWAVFAYTPQVVAGTPLAEFPLVLPLIVSFIVLTLGSNIAARFRRH